MITYYCRSLEDALKKAKQVAKQPGYDYWGKTFPDGKRGFEVFRQQEEGLMRTSLRYDTKGGATVTI